MVMGNFLVATANLLSSIIHIYLLIIIVRSLLSWLRGVNMPQGIHTVNMILRKLTDPVFKLAYKYMPFLIVGGVDLSPIAIILILSFIDNSLVTSLRGLGAEMLINAKISATGGGYNL